LHHVFGTEPAAQFVRQVLLGEVLQGCAVLGAEFLDDLAVALAQATDQSLPAFFAVGHGRLSCDAGLGLCAGKSSCQGNLRAGPTQRLRVGRGCFPRRGGAWNVVRNGWMDR
jgi:hypothetical protein